MIKYIFMGSQQGAHMFKSSGDMFRAFWEYYFQEFNVSCELII